MLLFWKVRSFFALEALSVFKENLFIGIGQDGYRYVNSREFTYSHNNYVEILANLGIVGFGRLALNRVTFVYSAVLCISVAANLVLNICVMSRLSLAAVGVLAGTGSVAGTVLFGVLFLNEKITCNFFLSIIFVLIAVLIPFVTLRPKTEKTLKASDIIISMLFFI